MLPPPHTLPFLKYLTQLPPSQYSNKSLSGPHLSGQTLWPLSAFTTWNIRAVWCGGLYVCRPLRWAAAPKSTLQSYRVPAAILAWLQRMTDDGWGGGASTGGCVQRSCLLLRWVPGASASCHGHNVFFFPPISLWCSLGELVCDTNAAMTGDGSKVNWEA